MLRANMVKQSVVPMIALFALFSLPGVSCTIAGEGTAPTKNDETETDDLGTGGTSPDTDDTLAGADDTSQATGGTQDTAETDGSTDTGEPSVGCRNGIIDVDEECDDKNSDPDDGCADCHISEGYSCEGEPSACTDINECAEGEPCGDGARCLNQPGSYDCSCKAGYEDQAGECVDIDECREGVVCYEHSTCENTIGAHNCVCDEGFVPAPGGCACQWPSAENKIVDAGFDDAEVIRPDNGLGGVWTSEGGARWTGDKDADGCSESGSLLLTADIEDGQTTTYCAFVFENGQDLYFGLSGLGSGGLSFSYEIQAYESSNCVTPTRVLAQTSLDSSQNWMGYSTTVSPLTDSEHSVSVTITVDPVASGTGSLYVDHVFVSTKNGY